MIGEFNTIYDISTLLGEESIDYPGDTPYSKEDAVTIESGDICNVSKLIMSAHSGTHIDAPLHFITNAKRIHEYSVEDFIIPAQVIYVQDKQLIKPSHIERLKIGPDEALLLKTENSMSGISRNGCFSEHFVSLSIEAADICVQKKLSLIGIDYISIEKVVGESAPVHRRLLDNDIRILEGINLKHVPSGRYTLICLPLKIKDCEASPVRAILVN